MVGDRYLTDVTFGNLHGMLCVRTAQLTSAGDNPVARVMHVFEVWLVALYRWLRVRPPPHRLLPIASEFVRIKAPVIRGRGD
jgi:phosphatidylglycerophosphatase GEP4